MPSKLTDQRLAEMEKLGSRSAVLGSIIGFLLGPIGYVYAGQWRWAVINFITLNYLLLGVVLVPVHVTAMIWGAKMKVRRERKRRNESGAVEDDDDSIARRFGRWYADNRMD